MGKTHDFVHRFISGTKENCNKYCSPALTSYQPIIKHTIEPELLLDGNEKRDCKKGVSRTYKKAQAELQSTLALMPEKLW